MGASASASTSPLHRRPSLTKELLLEHELKAAELSASGLSDGPVDGGSAFEFDAEQLRLLADCLSPPATAASTADSDPMEISVPSAAAFRAERSSRPGARFSGPALVANGLHEYHQYELLVEGGDLWLHQVREDYLGEGEVLYRYPLLYALDGFAGDDGLLSAFRFFHARGQLFVRPVEERGGTSDTPSFPSASKLSGAVSSFRSSIFSDERLAVLDRRLSDMDAVLEDQLRSNIRTTWLLKSPQFLHAELSLPEANAMLVDGRACKLCPNLPQMRELIALISARVPNNNLHNASQLLDDDKLNNALWNADWDIDLKGDARVSAKHCRLVCSKGGLVTVQTIADKLVAVNGVAVSQPWPEFATGDKLTVGGWSIRYVEGVKESISGLHSLDLDVSALPDSELDESLRDSGE
ncbi:hypothetical protein TeGR_g4965 [Tetraparma gracilis]|uniref:FHA domain-containing protein n=1 Tax=Tetraparma gracilis TaxID=2962635 RepID=A0ABQ6MHU0_9STRA|nr:hypothetical protein TeGR_g4965 [Tetraparma gracilis]